MSGVKKAAAFAAARKNQMGNLQSAWLRRLFFRAAACSLTLEELDAFHNGDHTHGQSMATAYSGALMCVKPNASEMPGR